MTATDTRVVPRSGWSSTRNMGSAAEPSSMRHPGGVEVAAELRGQPGEPDDQAQLGQLRRLELERPELEPALGAAALDPMPGTSTSARSRTLPP